MTQPRATTQANRRVFASAIAASGSSNAPGTGITVTSGAGTPELRELLDGPVEHPGGELAVEARDDDRHRAPLPAVGRALDHGDAVGDRELARRVLRRVQRHAVADDRLLVAEERVLLEPLRHASSSSASNVRSFRSWWCSRWPSFARLAAR